MPFPRPALITPPARLLLPARIKFDCGKKMAPLPLGHPEMDASLDTIRHQIVQLLPRLRRFAVALTGSMADGDDLVQDTVERALKNLHAWEPGSRLDSWMFRIAKNRFIDQRRAAKRRPVSGSDVLESCDVAHDGERMIEARSSLRTVSEALQN